MFFSINESPYDFFFDRLNNDSIQAEVNSWVYLVHAVQDQVEVLVREFYRRHLDKDTFNDSRTLYEINRAAALRRVNDAYDHLLYLYEFLGIPSYAWMRLDLPDPLDVDFPF